MFGFDTCDTRAVDAAHLPSTHTNGLVVFSINNRIGFDHLGYFPSKKQIDQVREHIERAAKLVDEGDWHPVICHHDMVPENIIETDRGLFIIDWEYAALGHPGLDFLRLYGADYINNHQQQESLQALLQVKQAMDKLWLAVQL